MYPPCLFIQHDKSWNGGMEIIIPSHVQTGLWDANFKGTDQSTHVAQTD